MEISNNNQVLDYDAGVRVIQHFGKYALELKVPMRTQNEISLFLQNSQANAQRISLIKNNLGFNKIWCRFDFGEQTISEQTQIDLIDAQIGVYDEITVQMIGDDVVTYEKVLDYAFTKNQPVSTLIDLKLGITILGSLVKVLSQKRPSTTRWKYRKVDSFIDRYRLITRFMKELSLPYYLVACPKRCGINNYKNIDASIIGRGFFGFVGCCLDYKIPQKGRRGFAKHTDVFSIKSYSWRKQINKADYRKIRANNFTKLDAANVSANSINQRRKVSNLFAKLNSLP